VNRRHVINVIIVLLVIGGYAVWTTDRSAKQRALAREEAYLESRLANASCLTSYGTTDTIGGEQASVIGHRLDGRTVRVTHPYWYATDEVEADSFSEAVYFVGGDTIRRVRGDPVDLPC
jgi:hypothetical protein